MEPDGSRPPPLHRIEIHAPTATEIRVFVRSCHGLTEESSVAARRGSQDWVAEFPAEVGDHYWLVVDGGPPLLDPSCWDLLVTPDGPRSVVREPWLPQKLPGVRRGAPRPASAIVYELHVRGFGRTYRGCIPRLQHVAATGANVIELMPVHPFDPKGNYWGYMPLVWGAVHRGYAEEPDRAAEELAEMVAAAHDLGLHVWLDVVFNHTGEGDVSMPTRSLRGLDDANAYRHHEDGRYSDDSGCGNDINPADPSVRRLVLEALDRYAALGIDGFRFDLASLLTRDDGGLVHQITEWGAANDVVLVAEPWDLGSYQVGSPVWPEGWLQWNDRFRDDVRGFLRGEPGLVRAIRQRVQGSPDMFDDGAATSINFVTAHDGLTLHDLTVVSSDRHRTWDCGPELRLQQMKNHVTLLLLSAGTPMWVMGDEFARTQNGNDNPWNIDGPLTWVDWSRVDEWRELTEFMRSLIELRRAHPPAAFRFFGVGPEIDESHHSHSLAWSSGGLYVMVNAWWQPLTFEVHEQGDWQRALATADPVSGSAMTLAARSIVVLRR